MQTLLYSLCSLKTKETSSDESSKNPMSMLPASDVVYVVRSQEMYFISMIQDSPVSSHESHTNDLMSMMLLLHALYPRLAGKKHKQKQESMPMDSRNTICSNYKTMRLFACSASERFCGLYSACREIDNSIPTATVKAINDVPP